jgi:hypothetical protein
MCVWNEEGGDITVCTTSQGPAVGSSSNKVLFGRCRVRISTKIPAPLIRLCGVRTDSSSGKPRVSLTKEAGCDRPNELNDLYCCQMVNFTPHQTMKTRRGVDL